MRVAVLFGGTSEERDVSVAAGHRPSRRWKQPATRSLLSTP